MNPAIVMWAHPRSVSTAFGRMMIERGDVAVVHEPLVTLVDFGAVPVGGRTLRTAPDVLRAVRDLAPVFMKDTVEYRYEGLFADPDCMAGLTHTFIVREPKQTIASHHALLPDVTCAKIGYEHQHQLFELAWQVTGERPVVIDAARLLADPPGVVAAYCAAVGLPFLPEALNWAPAERPEWERTARWHVDAARSSGFAASEKTYATTVDNDARLRAFHDHHRPFYERLISHAIQGV
ncbi:sulfotransferase-like domain-containing protein [Longispora urticae]